MLFLTDIVFISVILKLKKDILVNLVITDKVATIMATVVVVAAFLYPVEQKILPLSDENKALIVESEERLLDYQGIQEFRENTYLEPIALDSSFYDIQTKKRALVAASQYDPKFLINETEGENGVDISDLPRAERVADQYRGAVMIFSQRTPGWFGVGTAFRISEDLVLTNAHNLGTVDKSVADTLDFQLTDIDGTTYKADFLGADDAADVALLRLEEPNYDLPYFSMSNWSSSFISDQTVVSIGNPSSLGFWTTSVGKTVREYYVERNGETYEGADATIRMSTGASGSPVFGLSGELKGIIHSSPMLFVRELVSEGFTPDSYLRIRTMASYTKVSSIRERVNEWLR
jgi:S1-C subfamily serine protease